MSEKDPMEDAAHRVVTNHQEQYSVWPASRELPAGWTDAGSTGSRDACLRHVEAVWTGIRPLGLRGPMAPAGR